MTMKNTILTSLLALTAAVSGTTAIAAPEPAEETSPKPKSKPTVAEQALADLSTSQRTKLLDLVNEGSVGELVAVRGIGKARAEALVKARPFETLDEVARVKGIGARVFVSLLEHRPSEKASSKPSGKKSPKGAVKADPPMEEADTGN